MKIRKVLKRTVKNIFLLLVLPAYLLYELLCVFANRDGTFQSFSQAMSLIPGKLGIYTRAAFYRLACTDTSDEISIGFLTIFSHADTTIEKGVYIGPQCNIGKCRIGQDTLIGSGVHILSGNKQHYFEDESRPIQEQGGLYEKITIRKDCWLGNNSSILSGLLDSCIVAAGAVYTKSAMEASIILAGNPAKKIGERNGTRTEN